MDRMDAELVRLRNLHNSDRTEIGQCLDKDWENKAVTRAGKETTRSKITEVCSVSPDVDIV
jgi:hypothetical protein